MSRFVPPGASWQPDLPDYRDYSVSHWRVQELLGRLRRPGSPFAGRPPRVDLREYFPEVRDARSLNWSAAQACVALFEYFERRARGRLFQGSARFVYKTTRKLMLRSGDTGGTLRWTLKAMARFGVPPLEYWPDDVDRFDEEPDGFLYAFADTCRSMVYVRLDHRNTSGTETLETIKAFLAAGIPCVFGFSVPSSLTEEPDIPWRPTYDSVQGGHTVVAVGYDDHRLRATRGALLIRNCWGPQWGEGGYGWLPYRYVQHQLVRDVWTVLAKCWLASGEFGPLGGPPVEEEQPSAERRPGMGDGMPCHDASA